MKKHVGIITADTVLYNKIRLLLRETATVTLADVKDEIDSYDLLLADVRAAGYDVAGAVLIGEGGRLPLLFKHEDLCNILDESGRADHTITLSAKDHTAYVFGDAVRLTEVEFKLLEVILSADGYVTKQELLRTVWGDGYDEGVVNVYVHYLRRKLERDGQKVIISSRNEGYKISEKYRRKS